MPGLVRKILIFAAVDGLVLQPAPPRNHKAATEQAIKLDYKSSRIGPLLKDRSDEDTAPNALEVHGIVGLLKVASLSFLISISRREEVAQIRGRSIYSISEVAIIPLSSQGDAEKAIIRARDSQRRHNQPTGSRESSDEEYDANTEDERDDVSLTDDSAPSSPPAEPNVAGKHGSHARSKSVAKDVMQQRGFYGRFTQMWFSKSGWAADRRREQGMGNEEDVSPEREPAATEPLTSELQNSSVEEAAKQQKDGGNTALSNEPPPELGPVVSQDADQTIPLLPKLLTVSKFFFGSKSFYFSYDYDLSRPIQQQSKPGIASPLNRSFDPLFFWNRHLIEPFVEAGQQSFALPLIQGFVGQRAFTVDSPSGNKNSAIASATTKPADVIAAQGETAADSQTEALADAGIDAAQPGFDKQYLLTLISRRSVNRPGLRYLRRGIDESGHVANFVETEQILSSTEWDDRSNLCSFLQCRGSIPLFFSQSPYSLKPIVQMAGSWDQNASAFRSHFQHILARYGQVQVASLVEKHGNESKIGAAYEKHASVLNDQGGIDGRGAKLNFEWFDFHSACRGMKFENVSQLFDILGDVLKDYSWTTFRGDQTLQKQVGILRTNCMDCLDRTNVVQSACARQILEQQLGNEGVTIDLQTDPRTAWFNTLWADNGDAISRQYAGTAALKGDFTRTRKRNITGALTDFGLTLTRYYNNIVNDYFTQNVIDFVLGRVDESVLIDFEADMKAQDYAIDMRRVRQNAIETCRSICLENDTEDLIAGWTLSCPSTAGSLRSLPFEECVLLLTERALYFCRLDWTTEKVREFERISLEHVGAVARGAYITSTLATREMDDKRNVGFVLHYATPGPDLVRRNTRTLGNEDEQKQNNREGPRGTSAHDATKVLAFKALPPKSSFVDMYGSEGLPPSETEMIKNVTEQIVVQVNKVGAHSAGATSGESDSPPKKNLEVQEKDIISLNDAKRSTGYLEQLGFSLKKLVWA